MSVTLHPGHVYRDELGLSYPGVTSILGLVPPWSTKFQKVNPETLEHKRQVGAAVHHGTALEDMGFEIENVDDEVAGYLAGWRDFCRQTQFTATWIEQVVWHQTVGYAGTLDRLGTVGTHRALIDIKTSSESEGLDAGPQTAAYLAAAQAMNLDGSKAPIERFTVHLRADGQAAVVHHKYKRDLEVFRAALELYNFNLQRKGR